jgi:hypothetical protein
MIKEVAVNSKTVRYKHFAPAGDLVACLPGMRQVYRETGKKAHIYQRLDVIGHYYEGAIPSTFTENGEAVCMSKKHWDMLVPLLEAQDYVYKCDVWEGQKADIDLDELREFNYTPRPHGSLYHWMPLIFPQMATDFSEKFIRATGTFSVKIVSKPNKDGVQPPVIYTGNIENKLREKVIVTRTERYTNQNITYFFLKEYEDRLVFAGTPKEYDRFCAEWKLDIPYLEVNNFLELAQAIARCKFYISNQTLGAHLANGVAKKRLIEIFPPMANVWPTTKNGYPFMHNVSLEYYFKRFINE